MWGNFQLSNASNAHPLDTVEQARYKEHSVDANIRDKRRPVVFYPRVFNGPPGVTPPDWVALVEPHADSHSVKLVAFDQVAVPGNIV